MTLPATLKPLTPEQEAKCFLLDIAVHRGAVGYWVRGGYSQDGLLRHKNDTLTPLWWEAPDAAIQAVIEMNQRGYVWI